MVVSGSYPGVHVSCRGIPLRLTDPPLLSASVGYFIAFSDGTDFAPLVYLSRLERPKLWISKGICSKWKHRFDQWVMEGVAPANMSENNSANSTH